MRNSIMRADLDRHITGNYGADFLDHQREIADMGFRPRRFDVRYELPGSRFTDAVFHAASARQARILAEDFARAFHIPGAVIEWHGMTAFVGCIPAEDQRPSRRPLAREFFQ